MDLEIEDFELIDDNEPAQTQDDIVDLPDDTKDKDTNLPDEKDKGVAKDDTTALDKEKDNAAPSDSSKDTDTGTTATKSDYTFSDETPPSEEHEKLFNSTLNYISGGEIPNFEALQKTFEDYHRLKEIEEQAKSIIDNPFYPETAFEKELLARAKNGGDLAGLVKLASVDYSNMDALSVYKEAWMINNTSGLSQEKMEKLFNKHLEKDFGDLEDPDVQDLIELEASKWRQPLVDRQNSYMSEYSNKAPLSNEEIEAKNAEWYNAVETTTKDYEELPVEIDIETEGAPKLEFNYDLTDTKTKITELCKNPQALWERYQTEDANGQTGFDIDKLYHDMTILENYPVILAKAAKTGYDKGYEYGKMAGFESMEANIKGTKKEVDNSTEDDKFSKSSDDEFVDAWLNA